MRRAFLAPAAAWRDRRGLLARIADGGRIDDSESILAHLRALLNARRGEALSAPSFGVPDLSDFVDGVPNGGQRLAAVIRSAILEHEPRLQAVCVRHVAAEGELALRFEISARRGECGAPLRVDAAVRADGAVEVTGREACARQ